MSVESAFNKLRFKLISSPILKATKANNLKELNLAMQHHSQEIDEREPDNCCTALMIACSQGFAPGARELLARGANVKLLSRDHKNALHYAVISGNMECCKALLHQKHSPEEQVQTKDKWGKTPLDYCSPKHADIASLLQCYCPPRPSVHIPAPSPATEVSPYPRIGPDTPDTSTPKSPWNGVAPSGSVARPSGSNLGRDSPRVDAPSSPLVRPSQHQNVYYPPNPDPNLNPMRPPQSTNPAPPVLPPASTRFPGIPRYPLLIPSYPQPSQSQPPSASPWNGYANNGYPPAQSSGDLCNQGSVVAGTGPSARTPSSQTYYPVISSGTSPTHPSVAQVQEQIQRLSMSMRSHEYNPLYGTSVGTGAGAGACAPSAPPLPSQNLQQYQQHLYYQLYHQQLQQYERQLQQQQLQAMQEEERKKKGVHSGTCAESPAPCTAQMFAFTPRSRAPPAESLALEEEMRRNNEKHNMDTENLESMLGRKYTRAELELATDYFSPMNKLGGGGFGAVYKGLLDGTPVAIKVMDESPEAMQGIKEFAQEMVILSRMRHPHIVLLIGACSERGMRALVYELAEGGSLDDHMFRRKASSIPLSWEDRIRITTEVAAALLFLHSSQPPITHMDIKPANVLLTRNLEVKLGDVGLARIMKRPPGMTAAMCETSAVEASALVGTLTYVDPEYMRTGQFSTRSDVYALGMVMLQLLTGVASGTVVNTVGCVRGDQAQFFEVLDPVLKRASPPQAAVNDMMAYAELAMRCLEFRRSDRPDMRSGILPVLTQLRYKASMYASCRPKENSLQSAVPPTISESDGQSVVVPAVFICPITQEILRCPVVAADGYTYEENAIKAWIQRSPTSPLTNLPLAHTALVPNLNLRSAIGEWLQQIS